MYIFIMCLSSHFNEIISYSYIALMKLSMDGLAFTSLIEASENFRNLRAGPKIMCPYLVH